MCSVTIQLVVVGTPRPIKPLQLQLQLQSHHMEKFLFISYKSEDRDKIAPYLTLLNELRVPYWWDDQIERGWSDEIEQKLNECAAVVCFLTERAGASGPVYIECRTASDQKKLIPVRLDGAQLNYAFRSLLAFLNYVDLSGDSPAKVEAEKARLLRKIATCMGTDPSPHLPDMPPTENGAARLASWVSTPERQPHLAYVVALCVFDGQSHDMVQLCAARLEQKFHDAGLRELLRLNEQLAVKSSKFKLLGAESTRYRSRMLAHDIETVRYVDQQFGDDMLFYIWDELDQLKAPIVEWLHEMVEQAPQYRGDIAATVSKLGRKNFHSIYANFLHTWLMGSARQFRCADITLSLIASDPDVRSYIRAKLFAVADAADETVAKDQSGFNAQASAAEGPDSGTARQVASDETDGARLSLHTSILLATGYTGMAMPDLVIEVFKKLEAMLLDLNHSTEDFEAAILPMHVGLRFTLSVSKTDYYARSMLKVFAAGIHDWTRESANTSASLLPEFIFCVLLENITVGRVRRDTISLSSLLTLDGKIEKATIDAFARVISGALESGNHFIRERYKALFKAWCDCLASTRAPQVIQPALERCIADDRAAFTALFEAALSHASSDNDKDRIRFLAKSVCVL